MAGPVSRSMALAARCKPALCDFGGNRGAQLIDAAERRQFAGDRAFDNTLFIAVHYEPDNARPALMEYLSSDDKAFSRSAMVRRFRDDAKEFFGELSLIMPKVTMLEGDALARTSLSSRTTKRRQPAFHPSASARL